LNVAVDLTDATRPDESQRQQGDQLADAFGVGEMGVFEANAARF
jgi:hypothetical protein